MVSITLLQRVDRYKEKLVFDTVKKKLGMSSKVYIRLISERGSYEKATVLSQSVVGIDIRPDGSKNQYFVPWTSILYMRYET